MASDTSARRKLADILAAHPFVILAAAAVTFFAGGAIFSPQEFVGTFTLNEPDRVSALEIQVEELEKAVRMKDQRIAELESELSVGINSDPTPTPSRQADSSNNRSTHQFSSESPSPPTAAAVRRETIKITDGDGVNLDQSNWDLFPLDGTDGLDLTVYEGSIGSPDGLHPVRMTEQPNLAECASVEYDSWWYEDYSPGQWFCFGTSEGLRGYFQVIEVFEMRLTADVVLEIYLQDQ